LPERAFGLNRFGMVSAGKGDLGMIKGLLTSMGLAGLVAACVVQGAAAAPIAVAASKIIAPQEPSFERVYYYHGRYYAYHYNNRYYAHRVYRHGHWHYY
jgi:type IV secretory pathway TrbD component